ncbi:MAG: SUMF1/EgtB/PvdO family nonheme iron enzyme, partial [Ginsengibacter sp.]
MNIRKINMLLLAVTFIITCCSCSESEKPASTESAVVTQTAKTIIPSKMIHIPAGNFQMGTSDPAFQDAQPVHKVTLHDYWIDEHEVTNAEFAKFVN